MRSFSLAVVSFFTPVFISMFAWPCGTARAAPGAFLQDCATPRSGASEAASKIVIGRRSNDGNVLVAAMGRTGIYETRDRGATWDLLTPAGACHKPVQAFWDNAPDGDTLCVVTPADDQPNNVWCSGDRGRTWQAQSWITEAVHVVQDPSDPERAFGWTPSNRCNRACAGPTYALVTSYAKSIDRLCACNLQLAHTGGSNPRLYALRDIDEGGQNQLVAFSRDLERETVLIRETDPNIRMLTLHINPRNDQSFLVTTAQRTPLGSETGLCCDALYETANGGRTRMSVPLLFGPLKSVQFTNAAGDIAALVQSPHAPDIAYIGRKYFSTTEWQWTRAPEADGTLLAVDDVLYFAGKHLYQVNEPPYRVLDPVY